MKDVRHVAVPRELAVNKGTPVVFMEILHLRQLRRPPTRFPWVASDRLTPRLPTQCRLWQTPLMRDSMPSCSQERQWVFVNLSSILCANPRWRIFLNMACLCWGGP